MKMLRMIAASSVLVAVCVASGATSEAPKLNAAIERIMARPALARASFGIEIYDLDHGTVLYKHNAHKLFKAASTTKLVTEGTTLALLGPDFRFHTPVYRTGPLSADGTVAGNLVLVASGDPNLSGRLQPDGTLAFRNEDHSYDGTPDTKAVGGDPLAALRNLAKQISAAGVHRVSGSIVVDTSLFPEGDFEGGTGVAISPIVVNDNMIDVTVTPGAHFGDPVSIDVSPQTAYATFTSAAKTGTAQSERAITFSGDVTDAKGNHAVTISGTLPAGSPSILYAYDVPSPHLFAQAALTQALHDAGVQVDGAAFPETTTYTPESKVAEHISPPLSEDVKVTLKVSDNLHASLQPILWGALLAHAKADYAKHGFALENALLKNAGMDLTGAAQSDGLGDAASFAPDFMVNYLRFMRRQPYFSAFERGLPVMGVDGTLFNIQNGTPGAGHVHAKTGTWSQSDLLNGGTNVTAKGLAGYMTTATGRHLAFCFYINNVLVKHGVDPAGEGHVAGQILGEIANAAYQFAK